MKCGLLFICSILIFACVARCAATTQQEETLSTDFGSTSSIPDTDGSEGSLTKTDLDVSEAVTETVETTSILASETNTMTDTMDTTSDSPQVNAHIHEYGSTVISPSCTAKGYTLHKCYCGDSYKDSYVSKIPHEFGEWYVEVEATTLTEGEDRRKCLHCTEIEKKKTPIIPHLTCEERGIDVYRVQQMAMDYIDTFENAIADPTLLGTDRGGDAGWTLRISTYSCNTEEKLLERVKSAVLSEYNDSLRYHKTVHLHVFVDPHPQYVGDYFLYILYF